MALTTTTAGSDLLVVAALRRSETSDMQKLRERLIELEAEIKHLHSRHVETTS